MGGKMGLFDLREKQCQSCCQCLPLCEFEINRQSKDRRENICMVCKVDNKIIRLQKQLTRLLNQREIIKR